MIRLLPWKPAAATVLAAFGLLIEPVFSQQEAPPNPKVKLYIPYQDYAQEDNGRILRLFQDLRVSDVSDGMDVIGLADVGIVTPDIKPLWRDTENFTHRIVGIAVTARYVPTKSASRRWTRSRSAAGTTLLLRSASWTSFSPGLSW